MLEDIRYAYRQFRKNPGFAGVALVTLGLGIGAAAAIFGLIQSVLLSPPPYRDPDRLVLLSPARLDGKRYDEGSTIEEWLAWRRAASIEAPALYTWTFNFLVRNEGSESLGGMVVTRSYFQVVGLQPILGRTFTESETAQNKRPPSAIMLGYDLWRRRFGSDPHIVGKTVRISRQPAPLTVVGVMPAGVRFLPAPGAASEPNYDVNARVDFWLGVTPDEANLKDRWNVVARLRPGVTATEARAELAGMVARLAASEPELQGTTVTVSPVEEVLNRDGRRLLVPLFGSVALLFLIACANVAGLLVARGLQRQQEYAMRSALGAARWRLFRQVLTECVTLALASAILGAAVAAAMIVVFKRIGAEALPRADAVHVGWPVFAFGMLAALLAAMVAGMLPALRASTFDRSQLATGRRASASRAERRLLGAVATVQIVMTVALLAGAGLLVRSARNLASVRAGFDTERILAVTVTAMQRDRWLDFHTRALTRVASLPGVEHVAFAWGVPLTGNKWPGEIEQPGLAGSNKATDRINVPLRSVTPDYFAVFGIPLAEGRLFRDTDKDGAPRVAIVNQAFARRYFQGLSPLGRPIQFPGDKSGAITVVGVVADTRTDSLSQPAQPEIYFPFWQIGAFSKHLVLRASGDPAALAEAVRRELRAIDSTSSVEHMTTMAEIRRESMAPWLFAMRLLTGFAVAATFLSLVGVYGVLSLSVASRVKELGVRKAIGAQGRQIVGLVVGEGSRLIAIGLVFGTIGALLLGRVLEALLFDVTATDPLALVGSAAMFGVVALAVCLVPAVRAQRVNVVEALRQE